MARRRARSDVDDLVDRLMRLMDGSDDMTGPINLGNPDEHSVLDLVMVGLMVDGKPLKAGDEVLVRRKPTGTSSSTRRRGAASRRWCCARS